MSELRARITRASAAQGATALMGKAANLVLGILLARVLFPDDYGLFAICMIVTGLANLLSNFGFQSYLIQARELDEATIDACHTLNVLLSLALGLVVAALGLAWPGRHELLAPMLLLYGLYVFVSGLSYIELALLKRELDFKRSSRAELAFTLASQGGRLGFAVAGLGALCFPLGDLLGASVRYAMVRGIRPHRPALVRPRWDSSRDALWFGVHSTSIGLASFCAGQTDKLLLSLNFPVASVGLYAFAGNTAAMFYNAFIVPQTSVFHAAFSRLRDDVAAARQVLAVSTRLVFSLALPVNLLLMLETDRIIVAVFTEKWLEAAPLVRILAVDFVVRSMFSGIVGMQLSFGQAAAAARTKWQSAMLVVLSLLLAWQMGVGLTGYAMAYVIGNLLAAMNNLHANGRLLDLRWLPFLGNLLAPALVATASTLAWYLGRPLAAGLGTWPALLLMCTLWSGTYLVLSLAFNRMVFSALGSLWRAGGLRKPPTGP